jgi:hypothetical protein
VEKLGEALGVVAGVGLEEAKSSIATLIGQVMAMLRTFLEWALSLFNKIITYAGEHPLALLLTVGNAVIWLS